MKKQILVVDDEKHIRELCKIILEDEGYRVTMAKDGLSALQKMDDDYFELFIIDMIMPGMDGFELLKKIKQKQPFAIVIITTGFSSIEGAVKAVHAGAFQYLAKPINANELIDAVKKGVDHSIKLYGPLNEVMEQTTSKVEMSKERSSNIIFSNVNNEIKEIFYNFSHTKSFNSGDDILSNKKESGKLLLVEKGEISVWAEDTSVDYLRKGDCWGEEVLLFSSTIFTKLRAELDSEIRFFNIKDIENYFSEHDELIRKTLYKNLFSSLYQKWRKAVQRIVMLKMVSEN